MSPPPTPVAFLDDSSPAPPALPPHRHGPGGVDHLSACPPDDDAELRTALDALRARMNEAFQKAPPAIQKAWDEAGE